MEIELKKTLIALFATASVFAGVSAASADGTGNSTANLTVRATLTNGCGINFDDGASVIDFGKIYDLSEAKSETHYFEIKCTNKLLNPDKSADTNTYAPSNVALNQGSVTGSTITNRLLGNISAPGNTDTLQFQVYKSAQANGDVWGDQASGSSNTVYTTPASDPAGTRYPFTVSLLPQTIDGKTSGTYQSVMVATVNYTVTAGTK